MTIGIAAITGAAGLLALFAIAFAVAHRIDNYSIVDVVWSYAFGMATVFYAAAGNGWTPRRVGIVTIVGVWSARLGTHLATRVRAHHPVEDGRYVEMRREWGDRVATQMFRFFQIQAVSVVVLAVPFLLIANNRVGRWLPLELCGAFVWGLGIVGESVADAQLAAFKAESSNQGRVCDVGLWGVSRHPNYFFEWTIWVGYWLIASAAPWGVLTIVSPAIILYLLTRLTGIPLNEAQALRTRGDAYRRYQRRTSAFVPLPRRAEG